MVNSEDHAELEQEGTGAGFDYVSGMILDDHYESAGEEEGVIVIEVPPGRKYKYIAAFVSLQHNKPVLVKDTHDQSEEGTYTVLPEDAVDVLRDLKN